MNSALPLQELIPLVNHQALMILTKVLALVNLTSVVLALVNRVLIVHQIQVSQTLAVIQAIAA